MPFEIIARTDTRAVFGGKLLKVREFTVVSLPSETVFQFRRNAKQPCYSAPGSCADQFSNRIEAVLADPRVVDVAYSQDTTPAGRLEDVMTTYYESQDGALEGSLEQKLMDFGPNVTLPLVDAALGEAGGSLGGGGGGAVEAA